MRCRSYSNNCCQKKLKTYSASKTRQSSKNKTKINKGQLKMWESILDQINNVSDKVIELSKSRKIKKKTENDLLEARNHKSVLDRNYELFYDQRPSRQLFSRSTQLTPQPCNKPCHELMKKLIDLKEENKNLKSENQDLGKRLYFEEKEKKQLRWELENEKQNRAKQEKTVLDFAFVNPKSQISNISPFQESLNFSKNMRNKQNYEAQILKSLKGSQYLRTKRNKNSESMLIEPTQSVLCERSMNKKDNSMVKKISLEKQLEQLLQMSYIQKNKEKKNKIRRYMENIAKEIKSIN